MSDPRTKPIVLFVRSLIGMSVVFVVIAVRLQWVAKERAAKLKAEQEETIQNARECSPNLNHSRGAAWPVGLGS